MRFQLNQSGRRPRGLLPGHVRRAVDYVEQQGDPMIDVWYEQANLSSAPVGILGAHPLACFPAEQWTCR
jgi:hypothetical protein